MSISNWLQDAECTACGACLNICPQNAIAMEEVGGFLQPRISNERCVECKKCMDICPVYHPKMVRTNRTIPTVYAAWSKDEETLYQSTSGGVFSELARTVMAVEGVAFGAVYAEAHRVCHSWATDEESLSKMRKSKYVQSDIGRCFQEVQDRLKSGVPVLFSGTPCQVVGLYAYLGRDYENLYTAEIICYGVNSPKAYRKWLEMQEENYHSKITKLSFRHKKTGWKSSSTRIEFENGQVNQESNGQDLFLRGFFSNFYIRPSCTNCDFKGFPRYADLTIGDFWGIDKSLDADEGISAVLVNNAQGEKLFMESVDRLTIVERPFEEVVNGNPLLMISARFRKRSVAFFERLNTEGFAEAMRKACMTKSELEREEK